MFLLLQPHRSHLLGSSQEAARDARLLPFTPVLLAVCLLDSSAGFGEGLAKDEQEGKWDLTCLSEVCAACLGWECSRLSLVLFF